MRSHISRVWCGHCLPTNHRWRGRWALRRVRSIALTPDCFHCAALRIGIRWRRRAIRAAGELGQQDLLSPCMAALRDDDPECRFWAGWSSVLLGDRGAALDLLATTATTSGPNRARAFDLSLQARGVVKGHRLLQDLATEPEQRRWVIRGSGVVGDATYIPWLIRQMAEPMLARVAGQAFAMIAGLDLSRGFDEKPEDFESGPDRRSRRSERRHGSGRWPAVAGSCRRSKNGGRPTAAASQPGTRYFMGAPVTREHCIDVLKNGYQRQRILAAHYLCLLEPGTPLFNTSAPAWRQQRLLAKMT